MLLNSNLINIINASNPKILNKNGIFGIFIDAGTSIGTMIASNNLRGICVVQGENRIAFVSDYNTANIYVLANHSYESGWNSASEIK